MKPMSYVIHEDEKSVKLVQSARVQAVGTYGKKVMSQTGSSSHIIGAVTLAEIRRSPVCF
jgi:hypothetical protein